MLIYPADEEIVVKIAQHESWMGCPEEWFRYETWSVAEGLLLLAGVDPVHANVEWQKMKGRSSGWIDGVLLEQSGTRYSSTKLQLENNKYAEAFSNLSSEEECEADKLFNVWLSKEKIALTHSQPINDYLCVLLLQEVFFVVDCTLCDIFARWLRRIDAEEKVNKSQRYEVDYFLGWVQQSKLEKDILWWNDAVSQGFINDSQIGVYLSRVEKKNDAENVQNLILDRIDAIADQLPNVISLAEHGNRFKSGRKKGSLDLLSELMLKVYESHIEIHPELTAKILWEKIPLGEDPKLKINIEEKIEETADTDDWVLSWKTPDKRQKELKYSGFKEKFTKVKKRYNSKNN